MNRKGRSTFLLISNIIDKHLISIVVIIIIVALISPFLVTWLYSWEKPLIYSDISADALLTYLGSIFGWCIALLAAAITVFQARKVVEMEKQAADDSRRTEIKPSIAIIVEEGYDSGTFVFQFFNSSNYDAHGIYIFDSPLFPLLKRQDHRQKNITFDINSNSKKAIKVHLNDGQQLPENGLPKQIEIFYFDIDHNLISETFRHYKENDNLGYKYVNHQYEK